MSGYKGPAEGFEMLTLFRAKILKTLPCVGQHPIFQDPV